MTGFVEMVTVSKQFSLVQVPKTVQLLIKCFEPCKVNFTYCKIPGAGAKPPAKKRLPINAQTGSKKRQGRYQVVIHQADSDFTGIAFHPNYYCWFERARTEMLTREILSQAASVHGGLPVIRSAKLQYKNGARPYEPMTIITELRNDSDEPADYVISLDQRLYRTTPEGTQQELVTAQIDLCFVDAQSKSLIRIPSIVRDKLQ